MGIITLNKVEVGSFRGSADLRPRYQDRGNPYKLYDGHNLYAIIRNPVVDSR